MREETEIFIDNLLIRICLVTEMIKRTGLAPREFKFPFPGGRIFTFLGLEGK